MGQALASRNVNINFKYCLVLKDAGAIGGKITLAKHFVVFQEWPQILSHCLLSTALLGRGRSLLFTEEETKAQRG